MSAERRSADGRQMTSPPARPGSATTRIVAVETDDHPDPAEVGVTHRDGVAGATHPRR